MSTLKTFADSLMTVSMCFQEEEPITNPQIAESVFLSLTQELTALQQNKTSCSEAQSIL